MVVVVIVVNVRGRIMIVLIARAIVVVIVVLLVVVKHVNPSTTALKNAKKILLIPQILEELFLINDDVCKGTIFKCHSV